MTESETEAEISKKDAAAIQLDWAIRLFLDHRAFVPAITLAGAAEELIGNQLANKSSQSGLVSKLSEMSGLNEKEIRDNHLNKAKNWFKHWNNNSDGKSAKFNLESEAIQYIVRALTNFGLFYDEIPIEAPRFDAWLRNERPDLVKI